MHESTFGSRLRDAMVAVDLNPTRLAERIGVSKQTIYRWLAANEAPAIQALIISQLAETLGVAGRYLILGGNEPALRMTLTPDECLLIERFRKLPKPAQCETLKRVTRQTS